MTQAMLETECSIESDAATAVAQETTIAATTDLGQALEIAAAAKPVAVPVSRAIGGTRKRRRSDQRWQVTEADLNMYGLIVGRAPTEAERIAALTPVPNEATALRDAGAGRGGLGGLLSRWHERAQNGEARGWSPAVMFAYLRGVYSFSANLTGPQVSAWVRQVSTEARRRLQETQARLVGARSRLGQLRPISTSVPSPSPGPASDSGRAWRSRRP